MKNQSHNIHGSPPYNQIIKAIQGHIDSDSEEDGIIQYFYIDLRYAFYLVKLLKQ